MIFCFAEDTNRIRQEVANCFMLPCFIKIHIDSEVYVIYSFHTMKILKTLLSIVIVVMFNISYIGFCSDHSLGGDGNPHCINCCNGTCENLIFHDNKLTTPLSVSLLNMALTEKSHQFLFIRDIFRPPTTSL